MKKMGFVVVMVILGTAAATGLIIPLTEATIRPEMQGRYRSHTVSAREMDGQLVVTFIPALARDDRTILGGAEYALRRFLKVTVVNPQWRTVLPYVRVTSGSDAVDVLLIKNDDGTVHSMLIAKRASVQLATPCQFHDAIPNPACESHDRQ
jgi:hypothetical protein